MNNEFTSRHSQTDWQRLDTMEDEDIDLSDCPEVLPEQFAKAIVRRVKKAEEKNEETISVKFHPKVLAWAKEEAKKRGVGYETVINEALLEKLGS